VSLTQTGSPQRTPRPHRTRLAMMLFLFLCLVGLLAAAQGPPGIPELEIFPKHFLLHPGEQIHYQVRIREGDRSQSVPKYEFAIEKPEIVRPIEPRGELFIEALRPGRTELV
jgi:hypothetical protein